MDDLIDEAVEKPQVLFDGSFQTNEHHKVMLIVEDFHTLDDGDGSKSSCFIWPRKQLRS